MMSGVNVMDSTFVITFFTFLKIGGTLCYGDFFYNYGDHSILGVVLDKVTWTKIFIFYLISVISLAVPVMFNIKINGVGTMLLTYGEFTEWVEFSEQLC